MIGQVLRISTVFANIMLASSLALSITIAIAGTIERSRAGCYACLHVSEALGVRPAKAAVAKGPAIHQARPGTRIAGSL